MKAIVFAAFNHDLILSDLIVQPKNDLDELLRQYNTMLKTNLDKHAPLQKKTVTVKDPVPWYNDAIRKEKRKRRQCERRWRRTGLTIHREIYVSQQILVNQLIYQANVDLYSDKIRSCGKDQQLLFKVVDELFRQNKKTELPDCDSDIDLADKFSEYFVDKISKIRRNLDLNSPKSPEKTS